jgi:hypothetical protein
MPPGYAPYPPPPSHWPPPRPKPRGTAMIVTGAVTLGLSLLGGVVRAAEPSDESSGSSTSTKLPRLDSASTLSIGQCVGEKDFANRDPKPTDCQNPSAVMELVSRGGANANCPDGKGHAETDYTTLFWDNATLCFAANFVEGDCYAVNSDDSSKPPFTHEDCDDPNAQVKVVQRVDGTTDAAQCSTGTKPIAYPHPARLYCLEPAQ